MARSGPGARLRGHRAYRSVQGGVLEVLRSSSRVRALVGRLNAEVTIGAQSALLPADQPWPPVGRLLAGSDLLRLPVVVVVVPAHALDVDEQLEAVLAELARVQLASAAFRPVLVLEGTQLAAVHRYGWAAELLLGPGAVPDHAAYLQRRLADVRRRYAPAQLLVLPGQQDAGVGSGLDPMTRAALWSLAD